MPGIFRYSIDRMLQEIEACMALGINNFILFPAFTEDQKDPLASISWQHDNFYLEAIRQAKKQFPEATIITDVAMDPYSSDGHDGLVRNGQIVNDETLPILAKMAVAQAAAGADIVGPAT